MSVKDPHFTTSLEKEPQTKKSDHDAKTKTDSTGIYGRKTITFNRIPSSSRHQLYFTLVLSGNLIIVFNRVDLLFTHSSLCISNIREMS